MWACEHAGIAPDLMCVGKAFAAYVPMAAVLASERVFARLPRRARPRVPLRPHLLRQPARRRRSRARCSPSTGTSTSSSGVARKRARHRARLRAHRRASRRRARAVDRDDRRGGPRRPRRRATSAASAGASTRRRAGAARTCARSAARSTSARRSPSTTAELEKLLVDPRGERARASLRRDDDGALVHPHPALERQRLRPCPSAGRPARPG